MCRYLSVVAVLLCGSAAIHAHGLLIPEDKSLPPLAMLNHHVKITLDDQFAITRVEQTFRNHTDRQLEATYLFPLPAGASVNRFTLWVNGKETKGELVEAHKARDIYTSIVRRTQDPALLEYLGNNLFRLRVFPILPHQDQKVALQFTSLAHKDGPLVEYVYPLKTNGKATKTLEAFSLTATLKASQPISNVYSPTHAIALKRQGDHEVSVSFEQNQALLDKDFQLFYASNDKDVGLTALTHRPLSGDKGFFSFLISPRLEMSKSNQVPRDVVLVLDTSGSMRGVKMEQARKALQYCLDNLSANDRFGLINFATTVNRYEDKLLEANTEQVSKAKKWVADLEATGGTAIHDALASALELRDNQEGRSFVVVFFTDGQPTIGETDIDKILKHTLAKNTASTRIFTFGVGDDVNATMLDQLAERTRALASYARPQEDIEAKVSGLYSKISHPVLTNLKLSVTGDIKLSEVYPAELPDLFHGSQLVVFGRYSGKGPSAVKLLGQVGKEQREFVYELTFPEKTGDEREFVEQVWARRKVGYLLDQIRANGEKKELVEEVVHLAKKYGITTPYTSYLVVPDGPLPVVNRPRGGERPNVSFGLDKAGSPPPGLMGPGSGGGSGSAVPVESFAREVKKLPQKAGDERGKLAEAELRKATEGKGKDDDGAKAVRDALDLKTATEATAERLRRGDLNGVQAGRLGVDLSVYSANLRGQARLAPTAVRQVWGRNCLEVGGVWIDEGFTDKTPRLVIKAQSDAYFKLLERQQKLKEVFKLGNYLVWVAPSGTALVIDMNKGKDTLSDSEIDKLFVAKK